ncbi:hypothetical protein G6031_04080 [Dietzia sp. CQ4]|uniref:type II secretion system F family protein n=1 Tax=Dietzia sp. (strain CQ4) TaxID=370437 RepID=UPI0015F896DD|nr:hypothetical protein [Dietzia sp. CQ4]MBB1033567.1 hypothetical protein [Dietzia sp. CQ4]
MKTLGMIVAILALWAGVALIWNGWSDRRSASTPRPRRTVEAPKLTRTQRLAITAGFIAGAAVWLLTGWLVAVVVGPLAAWLGPLLLGADGSAERIERLDALSEWSRLLASSVSVTGLEQAIISTQGSVPEPIKDEVTALIARVRTNTISTDSAIRSFADDLDDGGTGDLICATLLVAVDKRGSGLRRMLESLADSVDEDVRNRRATEVTRRGFRTQTRLVTTIITVFLTYLFVLTDFMEPYKSGGLQIVLVGLVGGFAGALYWMRLLTLERPVPRFLGAKANAASTHRTPKGALS